MKKTILGVILLLAIMSCSSKRGYEYNGSCIICGKTTDWKSIGFCTKHYQSEKEQMLRGLKPNPDSRIHKHKDSTDLQSQPEKWSHTVFYKTKIITGIHFVVEGFTAPQVLL